MWHLPGSSHEACEHISVSSPPFWRDTEWSLYRLQNHVTDFNFGVQTRFSASSEQVGFVGGACRGVLRDMTRCLYSSF